MSEQVNFTFVIDTDSYAGNFEREMTAFCTGQIGECEVGDDMAKIFLEEVGHDVAAQFLYGIRSVMDEDGARGPTAIWPTPGRCNKGGRFYDAVEGETDFPAYESVGIFFQKAPSPEMVTLMKERAERFVVERPGRALRHLGPITIKGYRLLKETVITTVEELPA